MAREPAGKMRACGDAGLQLGLVGLGFRVRDKIRVSVRDRVGVRVSDGVRVSLFYFVTLADPHPRRPAFYQPAHGPRLSL